MPFLLDNNASNSELSDAVNYLLANFGPNLAADPNTGEISGPSGVILSYLYKYLAVKYADSADGSVNFSNIPTNRLYYGLRNTNDATESTNPADYLWNKVAGGGFSTTKFLFYQTNGGHQINFVVGTSAPDSTYLQESGSAIDLDIVTTTTAYNAAAPSIYIWTSTSTPPARPTTTSTYTWATGAYTAPAGWTTSPVSNTTAGAHLWAITIPIIVNANTVTSVLDWTNVAYPIYNFSQNGETGTTGGNGISALTAYLVQSQAGTAPSTPSNTTGPTAPSGWSLTAPSVAVGQVLWYTFGRYNSSAATLDGVPAGQTAWGTPTAASVFQDIRSDNWNGSNPPTFGNPATYGTTGYYIQRTTGDVFFNNGVFRADINTAGQGKFSGNNPSSFTVPIGGTNYDIYYSMFGQSTAAITGKVTAGVFGYSGTLGSEYKAGVIGVGENTNSIGVVGSGRAAGGFFTTSNASGIGAETVNTGGGTALAVSGLMTIDNSTRVTNLSADFARTLVGTTSNQLRFVSGTSTGASAATFSGLKPGGASTNVWITMQVDSTTVYIPVWA